MSVSAVASWRPLRGQCLRHAHTGLLSVNLKSRSASLNIRAVIALRPEQRRYQSDTHDGDTVKNEQQRPSKQPKLTFRQFMGRAMTVSFRNLAYVMSPRGLRQVFRDAPISTTFIVVL